MTTPQTGLVIEVFSTDTAAEKRLNYWKVKTATVTGPTPYTEATINDKTSKNPSHIGISNANNCVWVITATL